MPQHHPREHFRAQVDVVQRLGQVTVRVDADLAVVLPRQVRHAREVAPASQRLEQVVQRYGDPADPDTDELLHYLDSVARRNLVLTFGGGVNEVQRELIAMFGLGLPRVPR